MKYTKILKYDEFEQLQDIVNNCHILEVISPFIRLSSERKVLVENNAPDNKCDENMIILPTKIACSYDNIQKVTRILQEYIDSLKREGVFGFSVGNFFSGDYESNGYVWNESSICIALGGEVGRLHNMLIVATNLMTALKINRIIAFTADRVMELSKKDEQKGINKPTKIKRIDV